MINNGEDDRPEIVMLSSDKYNVPNRARNNVHLAGRELGCKVSIRQLQQLPATPTGRRFGERTIAVVPSNYADVTVALGLAQASVGLLILTNSPEAVEDSPYLRSQMSWVTVASYGEDVAELVAKLRRLM